MSSQATFDQPYPQSFPPGYYSTPSGEVFYLEVKCFLDFNRYIVKINYGADIEEFQCVICGKIVTEKFHMRMHVENRYFPGLLEYSCKDCEVKSDT